MHDHEAFNNEKTMFGFWVYLMTDLLMFAALFAAFAVLRNNTFGGTPERDFINLPFVFVETMILLTSSFVSGLASIAAAAKKTHLVIDLMGVTFLLGATFLTMELIEFSHLFQDGDGFQKSASQSAFFTLVGTHGLHITFGLLWMGLLIIHILRRGLTKSAVRKLTLLNIFWHFLDLVWIFIFTIVYLMGAAI